MTTRSHGTEYEERRQTFRDDALRAVIDLRDTLRRASSEKFSRLVAVPPICVADGPPWDAFVAAVVEDEGAHKGIPVPPWTDDPRRFIKPFRFLSPVQQHRSWGLAHTHSAFLVTGWWRPTRTWRASDGK